MNTNFIQIKNHIVKKDSITGWSEPKPSKISVSDGDLIEQKDAWLINIYFDGNCLEIYFLEKEIADSTYENILKVFNFPAIIPDIEKFR